MFGSGPDAGDGNTGVVPMRFVWPYGGRSIFLSGSFTGWTEHIPLSPMEGCPTVFQVICSLTPGYHQYKFYVDGEWQHDEHQPSASGNYGLVNTIYLPREPDIVPPIVNPEAVGSNMELDDVFLHQEVIPTVSEADLEVSRHRILAYLSIHFAYELLPESGKVIALDVTLPVKQAFHVLHEQGVPVAPLWDFAKGQFVGVLSALDFIMILRELLDKIICFVAIFVKTVPKVISVGLGCSALIVPEYTTSQFTSYGFQLGNHGSNLTEEELETHTISAWKEGKLHLNRQIDGNGKAYPRQLVHAGPYDSLKDVALKILQNNVSTIPIVHSSSWDGAFPQLLHLASLSGILKCICRQFRHSASSLPVLQQPICSIPLGTWVPKTGASNVRPAMLRPNASLGEALSLLVQANVSSIPIVDDNDSLLDIYSRSDITALAKDKAYAQIRLDEISIHQALQLGQDANSPYGVYNGQRCQMCLRSDPLHKVMERLTNPGVRRLLIVEAGSKRVEGIISLSDVFRFLLGWP